MTISNLPIFGTPMSDLSRKLRVLGHVFAGNSLTTARELEGYPPRKRSYRWLFTPAVREVIAERLAAGSKLPPKAMAAYISAKGISREQRAEIKAIMADAFGLILETLSR
jgi:hypothetical protein